MKNVKIIKKDMQEIVNRESVNDFYTGEVNVEFIIIKELKLIKCSVKAKVPIASMTIPINGVGVSKCHSPDKWCEKTGKEIAFGKAMAQLHALSIRKLFGDDDDTNTNRSR